MSGSRRNKATSVPRLPSRREFLKGIGVSGVLAASGSGLTALGARPLFPESPSQSQLAADPLRPQSHLLPKRNWMNDPNGPIYWRGKYHMFFQYNPSAAVWGEMRWAHAVSPDMLHWEHLPVALAPTPGGYDSEGCFSGSAVIHEDVATFLYTGVKSVAPAEATLRDGTHNFLEVQCLATSSDPELRTLTKLAAPVLLPPRDPKLTGFRDPCVWRDGYLWYMGVGSGQRGVGGQVLLYRSTNLRQWEYLHVLASGKRNDKQSVDPVDTGEMWECPDFFALGRKFVLLYSTERKVFWQIGEYDPKELVFHVEKSGLLDYGAFYAPKSQLDENSRRILWGWIPETRPEAEFSAAGWAGCMSLPRELFIAADGGLGLRVIEEAAQLRAMEFALPGGKLSATARRDALGQFRLSKPSAEFALRFAAKPWHLELTDGESPFFSLSFNPHNTGKELQIAGQSASLASTASGEHELRLFLDASVVECIADSKVSLTTRVYKTLKEELHLSIPDSDLFAISSLSVWPLWPISPDRLTT